MNKIPVGQTIAQTYAFVFRRYLPLLGVLWLPFLVMGAIFYHFMLPAMTAMPAFLNDIAQHRQMSPRTPYLPPAFWAMMRNMFLAEFLVLLIFPVIAVGVTKEALGVRRGLSFVYLSIGKAELLVLGGIFTFIALYFGAIIVLAIVGGIAATIIGLVIASTSGPHPDVAATVAQTILYVRVATFVFYLVMIYFVVRLGYFLVPISTAEGRFGVWRSWQMTKGNFWRIIGVVLATMLPLTILSYAAWFFISGPGWFELMWNAQAHPDLASAQLGLQMQIFAHYALALGVIGLALAPISYGLMIGQSAIAYRALTGDKPAGPWEG